MTIKFTKMQGIGNDYIYVDCFDQTVDKPNELSVRLSDRHFGIGGDGIVLLLPSKTADVKMRMFNADGSEGKMCGNAVRCIGKYMHDERGHNIPKLSVETASGIKYLDLYLDEKGRVNKVSVDMGKAELRAEKIPVNFADERVIAREVIIGGKQYTITCVSMGNPHCVTFLESDVDLLDIETVGRLFEKDKLFPERVNTEFVNVIGKNKLKMRVWERGSGETLACGTGACAVTVAAALCGYVAKGEDVTVMLRGGELTINYTDERVKMTGSAEKVFTGEVEI